MSRYLANWKFETDFDGDHVVVTLKPLEQIDFFKYEPLVGKVLDRVELMKIHREVVLKYIIEMSGLQDAAGNALDKMLLTRDVYFGQLLNQIGLELLSKSRPANPISPVESLSPDSAGQPSKAMNSGEASV